MNEWQKELPVYAIQGNRVDAILKDMSEVMNENSDFDSTFFDCVKDYYQDKGYITENHFSALERTYYFFVNRASRENQD